VSRSERMFEIIQLLRSAKTPRTAASLAEALEVTPRTVYRDIAALQAMRVPIAGEAGVGYVMRRGFDLPPLMFSTEEVEAIVVGLALLRRTGDLGLLAAAESVGRKIALVLPEEPGRRLHEESLQVSAWGAKPPRIDLRLLRRAVHEEQKLYLVYEDEEGRRTERTVRPLAIVYYVAVNVLAAWCELRRDFRHFRLDRIQACAATGERFAREGEKLRASWRLLHRIP